MFKAVRRPPCSGQLQTGGYALCSSKGSRERVGRMMEMHSNDRQVLV
jgi:translation elongation factor EF-G